MEWLDRDSKRRDSLARLPKLLIKRWSVEISQVGNSPRIKYREVLNFWGMGGEYRGNLAARSSRRIKSLFLRPISAFGWLVSEVCQEFRPGPFSLIAHTIIARSCLPRLRHGKWTVSKAACYSNYTISSLYFSFLPASSWRRRWGHDQVDDNGEKEAPRASFNSETSFFPMEISEFITKRPPTIRASIDSGNLIALTSVDFSD